MSWTAVVPLKREDVRKSRLATCLESSARVALSEVMARHVVARLRSIARISEVVVLSPAPARELPATWRMDHGAGLNAELSSCRSDMVGRPFLVIHADLPVLHESDLEALLDAAVRAGIAIAPDRHGTGTNAVALSGGEAFGFAFGEASLRRHLRAAGAGAALVEREGLALDLDTPEDLAAAKAAGWRWRAEDA